MSAGLIIGKFMPPTMGHKYLVDFGLEMCGAGLTVIVIGRHEDAIPVLARYDAMRKAYGGKCNVISMMQGELAEEPTPHTEQKFWKDWRWAIASRTGRQQFDYVFASEHYGRRLASEFHATFCPVDIGRRTVPISGTIVRDAIFDNWNYILPEYRATQVKRVAIVGPESCGKTTLARDLAIHFETEWAPEWARGYLESDDGRYPIDDDYAVIARAHAASEDALAQQANKVLISDTDAVCTVVAAKRLNNLTDEIVNTFAKNRKYDLRLLCSDDVPFVADPLRYGGGERQFNMAEFADEYDRLGLPYTVIGGGWGTRFNEAVMAVRKLIR